MLNKSFQDVFDLEYFSMDRDGEGLQHWHLIRTHFLLLMCIELILRRNSDLVELVTGFTFFKSNTLLCDEVITMLSFPVAYSSITACLTTYVSPHKLEFEGTYVLLTVCVITDDAHSSMFTQVVLVLLKDDLRGADGGSHAKKASNLASHINLEVDWGRLELRPVDVDHLRALERRNPSMDISPIIHIVGCHLTAQTVLDAQLRLFMVTAQEETSGKPIGKCQGEGVGHLAGSWRSINEVHQREDKTDDRELTIVPPIGRPLT